MLKTILIYCLLAFSTAQGATWYLVASADTSFAEKKIDTFTAFDANGSAGDTLSCSVASYAAGTESVDITFQHVVLGNGIAITTGVSSSVAWIYAHGSTDGTEYHDMTITTSTNTLPIFRIEKSDFTFDNVDITQSGGTSINATLVAAAWSVASSDIVFTDCDFVQTSTNTSSSCVSMGESGVAITDPVLTNCTFTGVSTATTGLNIKAADGATLSGCTFTDCAYGLRLTTFSTGAVSLTSCDFTIPDTKYGVNTSSSFDGTITATSCTFSTDITKGTTSYGFFLSGNSGSVVATSCTFTGIGTGVHAATVASGTGEITLDECDAIAMGGRLLYSRLLTNTVTDCIWQDLIGTGSWHGLEFGLDTGQDSALVSTSLVSGCELRNSFYGDTTSLDGIYWIVPKMKGVTVRNSHAYDYRDYTLKSATPDATLLIIKGTKSFSLYNCTFDASDWKGVVITDSPNDAPTHYPSNADSTCVIYNMNLGSSLDKCLVFSSNDKTPEEVYGVFVDYSDGNFKGNYVADGYLYADLTATDSLTTCDLFTGGSNYSTADEFKWADNWGGYGPLTGITPTTQGFYPIGVQTAQKNDPVISLNQVAMQTPIEALELIRKVGLTGIELDWVVLRDRADAMNLDIWLNGTHPNGSGTWEAQAQDTLKVVRAR